MPLSQFKLILQQIEQANKRFGLIRPNDSILIGLSGGPDSVALIVLLSKLRRKYNLKLAAAHLNHALRAKQSDQDADFCKKFCSKLGMPFYEKKVEIRKIARSLDMSLEEAGREERYRFFQAIAKKTKANKIATAHTMDDQAETVLMRLIRGGGLKGLAGIPARRRIGQAEVIRPLIQTQKKALLSFLNASHLSYRRDRSNESDYFFRNQVRLKLLPSIEKKYNPQLRQGLVDLAQICQEVTDYLDLVIEPLFNKIVKNKSDGSLWLDSKRIQKMPAVIGSGIIMRACDLKKEGRRQINFCHIQSILNLLRSKKCIGQVHIPGAMVRKDPRGLWLLDDIRR